MKIVARRNEASRLRRLESWDVNREMCQTYVCGPALRAALVSAGLARPANCLRLDSAGVAAAVRAIMRTQPRERWRSIAVGSNDPRIAGSRRLLVGGVS